ncbi:MAG: MBL fold metallo-hydrolase [Clostridia bacterium]|nr:MBL fold metallo-hydrolase [Clostridia bacterium]
MKIIPIEYGKSVLPEAMVFENGRKDVSNEIVFKVYLIKTEDKLILADAGCETMPGFVMRDFTGTVKALEKIDIHPSDITDVLITHSHHDHIECVKYFENATIHIEKGEYESGKKYIPDGFKVNAFSEVFHLSENVKIIKIGGHSKGSCIVEIKSDDKIYIIAGDECYKRECLNKKIPTGASFDKKASREFIEKYSDKKYTVLLCHDE